VVKKLLIALDESQLNVKSHAFRLKFCFYAPIEGWNIVNVPTTYLKKTNDWPILPIVA